MIGNLTKPYTIIDIEDPNFSDMTKAQLVEYIKSQGVDATIRPRKATLVALAEELHQNEMKKNEVTMDLVKKSNNKSLYLIGGALVVAVAIILVVI